MLILQERNKIFNKIWHFICDMSMCDTKSILSWGLTRDIKFSTNHWSGMSFEMKNVTIYCDFSHTYNIWVLYYLPILNHNKYSYNKEFSQRSFSIVDILFIVFYLNPRNYILVRYKNGIKYNSIRGYILYIVFILFSLVWNISEVRIWFKNCIKFTVAFIK